MKFLLTGFDPFDGQTINPAFEAVEKLPDNIDGHEILKLEIPTIFEKSLDILEKMIEAENPDVVICVGQAGGRFNITPEVVAINKNAARIKDNEGSQPGDRPIKVDGENAYFTTLPYRAIVKSLREAGIPSQVSYTAGTFVCNHIFYGLMYLINKKNLNMKGGFIHVPFCAEQTLELSNTPFMSLDMIAKSLEVIVKTCAKYDEDIDLDVGTTH